MQRMGLALAICLTGCLMPGQQPTGNVVATGEQLAVVDDVKVWTTTYKEKVAETEYTDANGNVVGKGAVYQNKTATHTMAIWYPVQGKQQLRDEDFFKIAGDQGALDQTLAMRANGEKWHTRGLIIMGAGIAGMIGGYITGYAIGNPTVETLMVTGGSLAVAGGYYATYYGAHLQNPETHAVDRSMAERAAQQYNTGLGKQVGVGVSGKF